MTDYFVEFEVRGNPSQSLALYKSRLARLDKDDPEARCLSRGVPRLTTTPDPFRFVPTPTYMAFSTKAAHTGRQIFMDGRKFSRFADELWIGESVGHWDDDTLVVETTGLMIRHGSMPQECGTRRS